MKVFVTRRFYWGGLGVAVAFVIGYYLPVVYGLTRLFFFIYVGLLALDAWMLFGGKRKVLVDRRVGDRLSLGDENDVSYSVQSAYPFAIGYEVLDEYPEKLQVRNVALKGRLGPWQTAVERFAVRPLSRGIYAFGFCNVLVTSPLGLLVRRLKLSEEKQLPVYPSFIRINQAELLSISNQLVKIGNKRIRRIGNSLEYDHIRSYVLGDDPRHINWKSTARRGGLQVNHYIDERAQDIYCLIDKSRSMKMPFKGMALLDYAINASLMLSHVALHKGDHAGLITFEDRPSGFLKAASGARQLYKVMEMLYHEATSFHEVDLGALYAEVNHRISNRSLLLLYTNFESIDSLKRQLPYLKMLNRRHLLIVIFFKNTEVEHLATKHASTIEGIFTQSVAARMMDEKYLIRDTLTKSGILALYTDPDHLSADVVNQYIEVKRSGVL